jgi:hypothetical protein
MHDKDSKIKERSYRFRNEYVAATPAWYRGETHLAFTLLFTGGVIAWCLSRIEASTWQEWLVALPIFLFGNWAEWAGHRYLLHRPSKYFNAVYKRHCAVHHQFFTHVTLEYDGHKEWRALLFPPFAPVMFVLAALPAALLTGWSRPMPVTSRCSPWPRTSCCTRRCIPLRTWSTAPSSTACRW